MADLKSRLERLLICRPPEHSREDKTGSLVTRPVRSTSRVYVYGDRDRDRDRDRDLDRDRDRDRDHDRDHDHDHDHDHDSTQVHPGLEYRQGPGHHRPALQ